MPWRRCRPDLIQLEFPCDVFNDIRRNWPQLFNKAADQRMLTKQIDDAGDTLRIFVNGIECFRRENWRLAVESAYPQAFIHVVMCFRTGECLRFAPQRDALPQLP